jgi:hypothetical protein
MVIGIIVAGTWITLTIFAVALCRAAGHAEDLTAPVRVEASVARSSTRVRTLPRARVSASTVRRTSAASASVESGPRMALFPH